MLPFWQPSWCTRHTWDGDSGLTEPEVQYASPSARYRHRRSLDPGYTLSAAAWKLCRQSYLLQRDSANKSYQSQNYCQGTVFTWGHSMASAAFSRMPAKVPPTKRDSVTVDMTQVYPICKHVTTLRKVFGVLRHMSTLLKLVGSSIL